MNVKTQIFIKKYEIIDYIIFQEKLNTNIAALNLMNKRFTSIPFKAIIIYLSINYNEQKHNFHN
jgi:hypothetical protein